MGDQRRIRNIGITVGALVACGALAAATGTPYTLVTTADELRAALVRTVAGVDVVEVRLPRPTTLHQELQAAVNAAL